MKVMTSKTEARGLQSRTEIRQTVAQMAAPNFKDSAPEDSPGQVMIFPRANSYFAPGKLGLCSVQTRTLLLVKSRFASGKLLARRAAMLLILMIGMVGNAWGAETTLSTGNCNIEGSTFSSSVGSNKEIVLRVYCNIPDGSTVSFKTQWYQSFLDKTDYTTSDSEWDSVKGCLEFELNESQVSKLNTQGLIVSPTNAATISKVVWDMPAVDNFESSAKSTCDATGTDITKYLTAETTQLTLDVTKATAKLGGKAARYARFYVLHNGVAENLKTNTTLLEITGVSPSAQNPSKGIYGSYLYNSGNELDLSGISVKLNAAAGKFPDYQVVCLLSIDAAKAASDNTVTEEPDWDVVFTYAFRNQVVTKNQVGSVAWDAAAMAASVPTTDISTDWGTSWANLAQEQKIEWYVTDGSDNIQPLTTGSTRQADTWTINLPSPFSMVSNVATMTGQTSYTATSFEDNWATWGNPTIYAPANKSFADVQDYKIICKIADDAASVALPNVIYTLSLTHDNQFGQEKSDISKTTAQVKLSAQTDVTKVITLSLPAGTKYARFYVIDENGTALDPTDAAHQLTITGGQTYSDKTLGYYLYNESGISLSSVTFACSTANLNDYQVVVLTSSETAVASGSTITKEPDYESQTSYWFNYPATTWNTEANVEWSPQSIQIDAPNIETQKGDGYLDKNKKHYTMQWYVEDDEGVKILLVGSSRVNDYWSVNVSSSPFTVSGNIATASNNVNLGTAAWGKWAAPQFYAPKGSTLAQLAAKNTRFVCKFYEDDDASDANMLAMTYTVYINKTEEMGILKDGGRRGGETLTPSGSSITLDLTAATTAFTKDVGPTPKYARVYIEKTDGTLVNPSALSGMDGFQTFSTATNGYYLYSESGITLPSSATLTLTEGQFNFYHVIICLSADGGENGHVGNNLARTRAGSVMQYYEPDYDYIYTIKFDELSDFPGNLDNQVKSHSKEVLVKSTDTQVLVPLNETKTVKKFVSELGAADFSALCNSYYHVRWFVVRKDEDGTYEKVNACETMLDAVTSSKGHVKLTDQGLYWNSSLTVKPAYFSGDDVLKVNFTKPTGQNWNDYKVIVWMTNDDTGAVKNGDGSALTQEPDNIKVQYIFSFFEEDKLKFIHSKGASGRDYMTKTATNADYRDARIGTVGSPSIQYDWDNSTSTGVAVTEDIRQSVHTVEYSLYVDPTLSIGSAAAGEVKLLLPFQNYTSTSGNNLEPTAYIRWYDYTTDLNSSMLKKVGTSLFEFEETLDGGSKRDRGWFHLDRGDTNSSTAAHNAIGVDFLGNQLGENQTAVIACDVSKYYDGIYQSSTGVLPIHEPTLSVRYIFTIRHAKVCAEEIKTKAKTFEDALTALKSGTKYSSVKNTMFDLFENNGRTVISLNGTQGEFSLRAKMVDLSHYHIYTSGSNTGKCDGIDWYAYYEDEEGLWYKSGDWDSAELSLESTTKRIYSPNFNNLSGTFRLLSDNTKKKTVSQAKGTKIHVVGFMKSGTAKAAAIHYELCFIDAPAIPLLSLRGTDDADLLKRTDEYLEENLTPAGKVTFDDKFLQTDGVTIDYSKPITWEDNIREMPLEWEEAEYSFCYPDIDEYRQDNKWTGFNPQHGDYLLVKSMNLSGVSDNNTDHKWYYGSTPTLRDYTYTYKYGDIDTGSDYGGFFYVDASDEARTMANLKFSASLCRGSEIHFTMAVADVTEGSKTAPQLIAHVYTADANGKKDKQVMSFVACTLTESIISGGTKENAKWYQYYGYGAIPATANLNGGSQDFIVEIDNNSKDTDGADFCVDQITFYTSTTKLKVKQSNYDCGNVDTQMNLYIDASDIDSYTGQKIYWRITDETHTPVAENADGTLYNNGGKNYGEVTVPSTLPASIPAETASFTSGYFIGNDGVLYFSLANKGFNLDVGKQYYVSVYNLTAGEPTDESLWGHTTNACDVYSPIFVPKRMFLSVNDISGNDKSTVSIGCGATTATVDVSVTMNMPDDTQISGFKTYTNVHFDYFKGTVDEYNAYKLNISGIDYYLSDALRNYRGKQDAQLTVPLGKGVGTTTYSEPPATTYQTKTSLDAAYNTDKPNFYAVLNQAVADGLLFLAYSQSMTGISIDATHKSITALPIEDELTVTDNEGNARKDAGNNDIKAKICTPLEFTFTVVSGVGGPSITLGFEDVTGYPTSPRVIRVGKKQIDNMQKDGGYILHVPVNTYNIDSSDATSLDKTGGIKLTSTGVELLAYSATGTSTNDAAISSNVDPVATFEGTSVDANTMYIALNFHGTGVTKPTFKEGFIYKMSFTYENAAGGGCDATGEFFIKVVPEFVTWNGGSNNWNNDANWNRSTRTELNKGEKGLATNTGSAAHLDGYEDNTDLSISGSRAFVPMKFTYVTMPSRLKAPKLVNLVYGGTSKVYGNVADGIDAATTDIQYDLMVRYTEETCQGGDHHPVVSGDIYDCEKFYGNWAKEIYFKPEAELLNQQYLTYEKVWVEKELQSNTWTLMSTPLQNTYAGDMYVPVTDDANTNGRQISEAFQPINFSTTDNAAGFKYSRTQYPIYQKGWTQEGVFVYTKANDVRASKYSANIPGGVSAVLNQWSHVYNDVQVPYSKWTAFAVRPHRKTLPAKTLIRLPKADTSYDYYQWDNTSPNDDDVKLTHTVDKATTGKLLTDGIANINGVTYGVAYGTMARTAGDGTYNAAVSDIQSSPSNYQLVGNPYLCTIDMAKFITANSNNLDVAAQGYWTYSDNNTGTPITSRTVGPMQSFFVKVKDGVSGVVFTPAMMVDGSTVNTNPTSPARPRLMLHAASERGSSSATIELSEKASAEYVGAEDVETLFDSNLSDVPMVFTVAGKQAVSIDQRPEIDVVSFGVSCAESNDLVEVTVDDSELALSDGQLYVLDAVTGDVTAVGEGSSVMVQPNDYGRYFLTTRGDLTAVKGIETNGGIVVSVRGSLVTVKAGEALTSVRALTTGGATVYSEADCGPETSFKLNQSGVYIIEAQTAEARKTVKIVVKN